MATYPQCSYAHLAEDARFCSNCGARIEIASPPAAESSQNLVQVKMQVEQIAGGFTFMFQRTG
ncbi:MAG TPA: hypothetical protein VN363_02325 [Anaerolineales bacterium]|nr:hypothetical protein [Anaerolineales bacterium]